MQRKTRIKRIGRYWIDRSVLDEGYSPDDIFETENLTFELPELVDSRRRHKVGWLICPVCNERSQVEMHDPACSLCGWSPQESPKRQGILKWAA